MNLDHQLLKLDYRLEMWDRTLLFYVNSMDERFRNTQFGSQIFYRSSTGVNIYSINHPDISYDNDQLSIYLQGFTREADDYVSVLRCEDTNKAYEVYQLIRAAIVDWSNNWSGWR